MTWKVPETLVLTRPLFQESFSCLLNIMEMRTGLNQIVQKMILLSSKAPHLHFLLVFLHLQLRYSTLVSQAAESQRFMLVVAGLLLLDLSTPEFLDDFTMMIV